MVQYIEVMILPRGSAAVKHVMILAIGLTLGCMLWLSGHQTLEVEVEMTGVTESMATGESEYIELFFSHHRQRYRPWNAVRTDIVGSDAEQYHWWLRTGLPIRHLRIDPSASPGMITLHAVRLRGPGGTVEYSGNDLAEVLTRRHQIEQRMSGPDGLLLEATGSDPQLALRIPAHLKWPHPTHHLPSLLIAIAVSTLLCWWLARRRHASARPRSMMTRQAALLPIVVLMVALTWFGNALITERPISGDAAQNLRIAYNLINHGTYSLDETAPFLATSAREPIPVLGIVGRMHMLGQEMTSASFATLQGGEAAKLIKQVNLAWVALGVLGFSLLALQLTGRVWLALLTGLAVWQLFFRFHADSLYTELPAAVIMAWVGVSAIAATNARTRGRQTVGWGATGLLLGALALTKSIMVFAIPAFLVLVGLLAANKQQIATPGIGQLPITAGMGRLTRVLIMGLVAALIVGPWMVRNQLELGSISLSEGRSGWVVYKRSLLNAITDEQYRGAFAMYGPQLYRRLVADTPLGIESRDFQNAAGYLAPLYIGPSDFNANDWEARLAGRPDAAVSLHQTTSATYMRKLFDLRTAGDPYPSLTVDRELASEGAARILDDPIAHLRLTPLMAWRGTWSMHRLEISRPAPIPALPLSRASEVLNGLGALALGALFIVAVFHRHALLLAALSLPVLMGLGYSLTSQAMPRFFLPITPFMLLALVLVLNAALSWLNRRRRRTERHQAL